MGDANRKDAAAAFARQFSVEDLAEGHLIQQDAERWAAISRANLVFIHGTLPPGFKVAEDGPLPRGQGVPGYGVLREQPLQDADTLVALGMLTYIDLPDTRGAKSPLLFCVSPIKPERTVLAKLALPSTVDTVVTYRMEVAGYQNNAGTNFQWVAEGRS